MFGQRQLASWILVMSISVLVVTTGDPDCYKSENGSVINLNIGGCEFETVFQQAGNSGGFCYQAQGFTKATAQTDKITFNNEKVVTKQCSVNFETIDEGKCKVDVSIHSKNPEGFSITFENASFYSPVTKSVPDWAWILWSVQYPTLLLIFLVFSSVLGVGTVIVCLLISSVLYCILHTKDEKASRGKKHSQGKPEKKVDDLFCVAKREGPEEGRRERGKLRNGEHGRFGKPERKFVDEMTIMKVITKSPPTVEDKFTVQEPTEKKTPTVLKKTPTVQKKAKIDFSKEDKTIMEEWSKQFEEKFKADIQ
ncbi:hypothetical protein M3Y94_00406500 [Aphelenchoides besseyi]|nr:hypothetical protein M3Y94_00406500 [Aphelenchoides besseyi]